MNAFYADTCNSRYATIRIGEPPQELEMDLNMLTSDFYVIITTSRKGKKYDDLFSQTIGIFLSRAMKPKLTALPPEKSFDHPYPTCTLPTDSFHLPTINSVVPLSFAYCRPSKFSVDTLGPSGSILGLAPSEHLRQTGSTSLLKQLLAKGIIERPIFSLMLINGEQGVLSIGGTGARAVDLVEQQTKDELDYIGATGRGASPNEPNQALVPRGMMKRILDTRSDWEDGWKWSKVQGAEGWWQILMHGVWVDGSKVLQNQAAVIDVSSQPCFSHPKQILLDLFRLNLDIEFLKID